MTDAVLAPVAIDTPERSLWSDVWYQFRHHRGAMAGMVIFALIVFGVVAGPYLYTTDPQFIDVRARNALPSLAASHGHRQHRARHLRPGPAGRAGVAGGRGHGDAARRSSSAR